MLSCGEEEDIDAPGSPVIPEEFQSSGGGRAVRIRHRVLVSSVIKISVGLYDTLTLFLEQ